MASALLAGCATAMPPSPIPDDDKDDSAAIQAQIDYVHRSGGGVVQLEEGRYDVASSLFMRSNVTLRGRGDDTLITSEGYNPRKDWWGTVIFAGTLSPATWDYNDDRGYRPSEVRAIDAQTVEFVACDQARIPKVGQVVWLLSHEGEIQEGDAFRPKYGEMNRVTKVDGCRASLDATLTIPENEAFSLNFSDGTIRRPNIAPSEPVGDVVVESMQIRSAMGQALRVTGCYRCRFENLNFSRTRRLFQVQGMRDGIYRNISGVFWERGIEITMFNWNNLIEKVDASFRYLGEPPNGEIRPAIRFGEFARGNILRNITLDLGPVYRGKLKFRFDASSDNSLSNITLVAPGHYFDRALWVKRKGVPGQSWGRISKDTAFDNVRVCDTLAGARCVYIGNEGRPN